VNVCKEGGSIIAFSDGWGTGKVTGSEAPRPGDDEWLDYCRRREGAERLAAKAASSATARRVHQQLAQAYAAMIADGCR
jgi:hypothetical protein